MNAALHKETRLRHLKLMWPFKLCVYSNCGLLSENDSMLAWGRVSFFFTPTKLALTVSAWWRSVLWYAWSTLHPSVTPSTHSVFPSPPGGIFKNKRDELYILIWAPAPFVFFDHGSSVNGKRVFAAPDVFIYCMSDWAKPFAFFRTKVDVNECLTHDVTDRQTQRQVSFSRFSFQKPTRGAGSRSSSPQMTH